MRWVWRCGRCWMNSTGKHPEHDFTINSMRQIIAACLGEDRVPRKMRIITDTSDFFRVDYNDVVILAGRPYLIGNCER